MSAACSEDLSCSRCSTAELERCRSECTSFFVLRSSTRSLVRVRVRVRVMARFGVGVRVWVRVRVRVGIGVRIRVRVGFRGRGRSFTCEAPAG